ncbi:MAG: parallel beta-helix domain-containing protein [Pseudomonadota bacterium]
MRYYLLGAALCLAACSQATSEPVAEIDTSYQDELQLALLDAQPGDTITIPAGMHSLDRGLSLTADGVTIRGEGMDASVLSFKGQIAGAEGLLITGDNVVLENFAVEDAKGDAIKISDTEGVTIRGVRVEWTGEPKTENGAYGLYPVQTRNVLIEDVVAIGASDAGIYVGQSKGVIVRNSRAERNVAGIEIENTQDADVYGNVATDNTGGILVFNMPGLTQPGARVRVFDNDVYENDRGNFGHPGTPVASIPAGSGVVVNSHDDIEIFENRIRDNRTANIIIASVYSSNFADTSWSDTFDPYPNRIHVHSNTLSGGGNKPDGMDLKAAKTLKFGPTGRFPHVLWDGYQREAEDPQICIEETDAEVFNADLPNDSKNMRVETEPHRCTLPRLAEVSLETL